MTAPKKNVVDLSHTVAALEEFDRTEGERERNWHQSKTQEEVSNCVLADEQAIRKVREAFALDTANHAGYEKANQISPNGAWFRRLIEKWIENERNEK